MPQASLGPAHPPNASQFLKRYSLNTIKRIEQFSSVRTRSLATVFHQDAREAQSPPTFPESLPARLTLGLIDYHEQHRYAYELLRPPR